MPGYLSRLLTKEEVQYVDSQGSANKVIVSDYFSHFEAIISPSTVLRLSHFLIQPKKINQILQHIIYILRKSTALFHHPRLSPLDLSIALPVPRNQQYSIHHSRKRKSRQHARPTGKSGTHHSHISPTTHVQHSSCLDNSKRVSLPRLDALGHPKQ